MSRGPSASWRPRVRTSSGDTSARATDRPKPHASRRRTVAGKAMMQLLVDDGVSVQAKGEVKNGSLPHNLLPLFVSTPAMRLHDQYRLLQQHYGEQPVSPGVAELAALLACSPRNVRLQLAKMQQQGWLVWQPGRGRGHRSVLQCLQPPQDLQWQRTHRLLQRGELEQAFASLPADGRSQLMAQLPAYLGASANRRQLRIPIHRPLATLDPLHVTSRLEAHLVRQVFDRLCSFDIATQTLQPALAHSWQADASARQWRFWLRPGVQFHDGSPLDAWAVAASVQRLHEQAGPWMQQYRGLRAIRVHDALSLSFELADTDWLWPQRLITANASIVPVRRGADFAQLPVGSGPFRVARHSAQRLSLEANLRYYRERPLLDGIDLWVLAAPAGADFHLRLAAGLAAARRTAGRGAAAGRPGVDAGDLRAGQLPAAGAGHCRQVGRRRRRLAHPHAGLPALRA